MPPAGRSRARARVARPTPAVPAPALMKRGATEWIDLDEIDAGLEGRAFVEGNGAVSLMMSCGDEYNTTIGELEKFVATLKAMKPTPRDIVDSIRGNR